MMKKLSSIFIVIFGILFSIFSVISIINTMMTPEYQFSLNNIIFVFIGLFILICGMCMSHENKTTDDCYTKISNVDDNNILSSISSISLNFDDIKSEMLQKSKKLDKKILPMKVAMIFFISMFISSITNNDWMIIFEIFGIMSCVIFYIVNMIKNSEEYEAIDNEITNAYYYKILTPLINRLYPYAEPEINEVSQMNPNILISKSVLPNGNKINSFLTIDASVNNKNNGFQVSNCVVKREYHDDGNTHAQILFKGQVFKMHFERNVEGTIRIIASHKALLSRGIGVRKKSVGGLEKIKINNDEFNNNFEVYGALKNPNIANDIFNTRTIETLLKLKKVFNDVSICIEKNLIYIGLNTGDYIFRAPTYANEIRKLSLENEYRRMYSVIETAKFIKDGIR